MVAAVVVLAAFVGAGMAGLAAFYTKLLELRTEVQQLRELVQTHADRNRARMDDIDQALDAQAAGLEEARGMLNL